MEQKIPSHCSLRTHWHLPRKSCYLFDLQKLELRKGKKRKKKLKMIEQLQSYNAKYKVVKNTEITAFLLFSIFFYFGKGNKGRVKEGNKAYAFSTMNFDIFAFNKMVVNWPSSPQIYLPQWCNPWAFPLHFHGFVVVQATKDCFNAESQCSCNV